MPLVRLQVCSSALISVPPMQDDIPKDVKQSVRSEVYKRISVLVNEEGFDVGNVLKCIFSIIVQLTAEGSVDMKYPSLIGVP